MGTGLKPQGYESYESLSDLSAFKRPIPRVGRRAQILNVSVYVCFSRKFVILVSDIKYPSMDG